LRVGVLGFGKVAEATHLPAFASGRCRGAFEVVAVAEPSPERRAVAARVLPRARVYESADALLAREEIDLADVAAPPFLHVPLVEAALEAGCHVLCEKPLSLDPGEVRALGQKATERGRVLFTVNNWRHAPLVSEAIGRAREAGPIRFVGWSVRRVAADPGAAPGGKTWREDPRLALGGILVDHGWHAFTFVHALLGAGPREVRARLREEEGKGDVEARVRIDQGGARVSVRLTWRAGRRANRARIAARSSLRLEDDRLLAGREVVKFPEKLSQGSMHPDWFPPVLDAVLDEIEGRGRGGSLEEALYCATTIEAAYRSARAGGGPVPIA
jgi:predicted dehydrogenase